MWIEQNLELFYVVMWLVGAWALSVPFSRRRRLRMAPRLGAFGSLRGQAYGQLGYSVPEFRQFLQRDPAGRSAYLRAQFFLLYCAGYKPYNLMNDWLSGVKWQKQRQAFRAVQKTAIEATIGALKAGRIYDIYQPHEAPTARASALNYPLLPGQFTFFVGRAFSYTHDKVRGKVEPGFYRCDVLEWLDENSYAQTIQLDGIGGALHHIDQAALLDSVRSQKATVESVSFLGMPLFIYTSRKRKLPRLRPEQYLMGQLPIRSPSAGDFARLDKKLMGLFGGVNPINLVRLSWFYHPSYGVKPDEAKCSRLVAKAEKP